MTYSAIYAKDLKTVKWFDPASTATPPSATPSPAPPLDPFLLLSEQKAPPEPLTMRLIRRPQITTLALPRSETWPSEAIPPHRTPWDFTPDVYTFAKFMLGSPDYIRQELEANLVELNKEIATLKRWAGSSKATDEELGIVFVRSAIKKVGEQLEKALELKTNFVMTARKMALRELKEIEDQMGRMGIRARIPVIETSSSEVEEDKSTPLDFLHSMRPGIGGGGLSFNAPSFEPSSISSSSDSPFSTMAASPTILPKSRPQKRNVNPPPPTETTFFFYQASSGQAIFLDGLDIKILKAHFGTYENFPSTLTLAIEGREEGSMNEDLRRRCRYLSHLPTGSDIVFIESDLTSIVSAKVLESFSTALKLRRNKRRDKGRREDKAKAKSEQREVESRPAYGRLEKNPSSYVFSRDFGQGSHSNPYTTVPYAGFMESNNFPDSMALPSNSIPKPVPATSRTEAEEEARKKTVWGTNSFATALHSSSRPSEDVDYEEGYDSRWHEFEESNGRRGGSNGGGGGSAGGSNSGGGTPGGATTGGKKKKGKKLVLNLSGSTRGSA